MSSYIHGRRRRRVQVIQTGPAVSSGQGNTVQPPRRSQPAVIRLPVQPARIVSVRSKVNNAALHGARPPLIAVPVIRRPAQPARVISVRTAIVHGSFQGARPQVQIVRYQQLLRTPQPVQRRTVPLPVIIPPVLTRWQPRPQTVRDQYLSGRWKPVQARTQSGRIASPAMPKAPTVGRWRPGPVPIRPQLFRSRLAAPAVNVIPQPRALRLPIIPWRIRPVSSARTHPQSPARPAPRIVVPTQAAVIRKLPSLPYGKYLVAVRTALVRVPRPTPALIIPVPRQPVRPRPPIQASCRFGAILRPQPKGVVLRRPPPIQIWPRSVVPVLRYLLASPALHGPMPRPMVLARPRLFDQRAQASYKPVATITAYAPYGQTAGGNSLPPDLVAAVIAWLRQQPAIVTVFGDSLTTPKFGSDIAARNTAPPYLEFFEPVEDESYETIDQTGLVSSATNGTLGCELVGSGKLITRQLAEQITATINNAPLSFQDGTLIYLYRSERKYPSFATPGPGTNVVLYKRYLEFDYKIERWSPVL